MCAYRQPVSPCNLLVPINNCLPVDTLSRGRLLYSSGTKGNQIISVLLRGAARIALLHVRRVRVYDVADDSTP